MKYGTSKRNHEPRTRQIVGFSLSRERAAEVKAEANRRGIRLKALFDEIWTLYKSQRR